MDFERDGKAQNDHSPSPERPLSKPRTTSSVRGETPGRRPGMSRPEMLPLQDQKSHSVPRIIIIIIIIIVL